MLSLLSSFFFNDTETSDIYTYAPTLSLHDALPICGGSGGVNSTGGGAAGDSGAGGPAGGVSAGAASAGGGSAGPASSCVGVVGAAAGGSAGGSAGGAISSPALVTASPPRSEKHTSELP